jgi:beta-glucanase (GH16 family)
LQAGPGEEIYWHPRVMRGGRDPVVPADKGGISLLARPIVPGERALIDKAVARQADLPPHTRAVLLGAGWTSAWLQTRPSFPVGTTVSAMLRPAPGTSAWGGLWMLNDPAHRRWPPEIDVAEVTNDPDGRMRVRQVIHYRDGAGQLRTAGCPYAILPRDWIVAAVTRLPHEIRFSLNGTEHCRIAAPDGFDDPMTIIVSQQVGGLAAHSNAATAPFALELRWVRVTGA